MQKVNWRNFNFDLWWNKNLLLIVAEPFSCGLDGRPVIISAKFFFFRRVFHLSENHADYNSLLLITFANSLDQYQTMFKIHLFHLTWPCLKKLGRVSFFSQTPWPCIQLLHAERHALCQWNLDTDQDEPAAQWLGHDQTDLQYQGCGHGKVKRATGKAWAWESRPHFEREKVSLVWACGAS